MFRYQHREFVNLYRHLVAVTIVSPNLLLMLNRITELTYQDGLQFVCEAFADQLSPDWVKEVLTENTCQPSFVQGVNEAMAIM